MAKPSSGKAAVTGGGRKPRANPEKAELAALETELGELLASEAGSLGSPSGAGIPTSAGAIGRTMLAMQKFRVDWFSMSRKQLFEIAAVLAERHWFVNPVVAMNVDLYGRGFRFADLQAREETKKDDRFRSYPFARVAKDLLREFMTTTNSVALWPKIKGPDDLPTISVPDMRDCEVLNAGETLKISFRRNPKLGEEHKDAFGEDVWKAMRDGKTIEIPSTHERVAWRAFTNGKASSGLNAPSLTGILDDLDFIEAVKCGDWNGAWQRRKMILQSQKGYGITSGSNAGITRGHAKRSHLENVGKWLRALAGAATVSTNFDQLFKHLVFPTGEHFSEGLTKMTWERLLLWAGFAGVLLFKSESQISGVSPYLMLQLRTKVLAFRDDWIPFLGSIFNDPSFQGDSSIDLTPCFGASHLYSVAELEKMVNLYSLNALAAPQTVREELLDLDDGRESERMKTAHGDRLAYTAVFEPRQGLTPGGEGKPAGQGGEDPPSPGPGAPPVAAT